LANPAGMSRVSPGEIVTVSSTQARRSIPADPAVS
jgi:hypothetical protein